MNGGGTSEGRGEEGLFGAEVAVGAAPCVSTGSSDASMDMDVVRVWGSGSVLEWVALRSGELACQSNGCGRCTCTGKGLRLLVMCVKAGSS